MEDLQKSLFFAEGDPIDEFDCEDRVDFFIEIIERLAKLADQPIYDKLFESVVSEWKSLDSPESLEGISNAWEFLGVVNYYGADHFLCESTLSMLENAVRNRIRELSTHEQILFNLANASSSFDWSDFRRDRSIEVDDVFEYLTSGEVFAEVVTIISEAIRTHAPSYSPFD